MARRGPLDGRDHPRAGPQGPDRVTTKKTVKGAPLWPGGQPSRGRGLETAGPREPGIVSVPGNSPKRRYKRGVAAKHRRNATQRQSESQSVGSGPGNGGDETAGGSRGHTWRSCSPCPSPKTASHPGRRTQSLAGRSRNGPVPGGQGLLQTRVLLGHHGGRLLWGQGQNGRCHTEDGGGGRCNLPTTEQTAKRC